MIILLFFIFFGTQYEAKASACCASSSSGPLLTTGAEIARLGLNLSHRFTVADVDGDHYSRFRDDATEDMTLGASLEGLVVINQELQLALSLPLVTRLSNSNGDLRSGTNLGDIQIAAGYEFLPEYSYSVWRPRLFVYSSLTVPTGTAIYEISSASDPVTGKGHWTPSLGLFAFKRWSYWDAGLWTQVAFPLSRTFNDNGENLKLRSDPGLVGQLFLGRLVFNNQLRVGLSAGPNYSGLRTLNSFSGTSTLASQLFWDLGVSVAFNLPHDSVLALSYTDQTVIGPAKNTDLARMIGVSWRYAWMP